MSVVNPGQRRDNVWMAPPWQMWVDLARVYSGLTYGHIDDSIALRGRSTHQR